MTIGYGQRESIIYEETFLPVVRFASIPFQLAILAQLDFELFRMDVNTTFRNGQLDEEIYKQLIGVKVKRNKH